MALFPRLFLLAALAVGSLPVLAAEPAYPPGSRVGLLAPAGMNVSRNFFGFEDAQNNAAIILVALPPDAYAELDRSITGEALKRQGIAMETREAFALPSGKAFLTIGRQEIDKIQVRKWILVISAPLLTGLVTVQIPEAARAIYPDAVIRAALGTVAIRATVPPEEQLGLLPFKVGDLAGFRIAGVLPGRALMLSDAPADTPGPPGQSGEPHMLVTVAPGAPPQAADRDVFAREAFGLVPDIKDIRVTSSESLRMGGQLGHQILAEAKDVSGAAVTVGQWLRFGGGGFLQMVGVARTPDWKDAYPRFRAVRDAVEPR
jgi:hypothetical protein